MKLKARLVTRLARLSHPLLRKLVPEQYLEDASCRNQLWRWFLLGLLIRVLFMPFMTHSDLIVYNWMAHFILSDRAYDIVGFLQTAAPTMLITTPLILYFQAFFLLIFTPVMPAVFAAMGTTFSMGVFLSDPHVQRALFLLKVPYLLLDLGVALLLLRLFQNRDHGTYAWKFWMVNPVVIFAVYMFSSYDVMVAFLIVLSLYYMKVHWRKNSMIALGLGAAAKLFPLLLAPFFVLYGSRPRWKQLGYAVLFCVPLFLVFVPNIIGGTVSAIPGLFKGNPEGYLFGMRFALGRFDGIFVVVAAYAVVGLSYYFRKEKDWESLWRYSFVVVMMYYATSLFHPQYFVWVMPLTTLAVVTDRRLLTLHIMQIVCFVVYTFNWERPLAFSLLKPLSPAFSSLPSPSEVIARFAPPGEIITVFRSLFTGISLYMMYLVLRQLRQPGHLRDEVR